MRILAITNRFPRPGHLTEAVFSLHQLQALNRRHEVRAIVPVAWTERIRDMNRVDTRWTYELDGLRVYHPTYWFTPKMMGHCYGQWLLWSIRKTLNRVLAEFKPDVLWGIWAHPEGWATVQLGRELGIPAVIRVIGSDVLVLARNRRRRERIAEALCQADAVAAVSEDLARHVEELGVAPQNVHVIPEGTNAKIFCPGDQLEARARLGLTPTGRMLLYVGNLLFTKGAAVLLHACDKLRERGVDYRCCLVGGGKDEHALRQMASDMRLDDRVTFAGQCAHDSLATWYRAADVVTLPSFSEGIPNVLREAMRCGKPFVATRVGGIPEISDPSISTLVAPGDAAALADALARMLASPPRVDESIAAKYTISWDESARRIAELLQAAIDARSTTPTNAAQLGGVIQHA